MGSRAVEVDPKVVGAAADQAERVDEVLGGLVDAAADPADHLDGVAEQLLVQPRFVGSPLLAHRLEELEGRVRRIARHLVDERELPLHPSVWWVDTSKSIPTSSMEAQRR